MTAPNKTHHVPFFRKEISMIAASTCTKFTFCKNVTYLVFAFSASFVLQVRKNPEKTSSRKLVPNVDRTWARCMTGTHATTWYTEVDLNNNARPHMARWSIYLLKEFNWEVFNHTPYTQTLRPVISVFYYISRNSCPVSIRALSEWERGGDECHTVDPIMVSRLLQHSDTKVGPMVWQMSQFRRWIAYVEK